MTFSSPKINLDIIPAGTRVSNTPQKVLFVGQMVRNNTAELVLNPVGTFDPGTLGKLVTEIPDDEGANNALYGPRSMIAAMLREGRKVNPITRFDAFVLPDSTVSGTFITTMLFTGTATEDGEFSIAIGSQRNHTVTVPVVSGDTSIFIEIRVRDAVNADPFVPVTGEDIAPGDLQFTAANRGLEGRDITLKVLSVPAGITVVITPATGIGIPTNPSTTPEVFDAIARQRYQTIVWPATYDEDTGTPADSWNGLIEDLETRLNSNNQLLDGQAIISFTRFFVDQKAQAEVLDTRVLSLYANFFISGIAEPLPQRGSSIVELDYVIASQIGAIRALRLTEGADISRFVNSSNGALDNFGGPALASLPYFNTPFDLLPVIADDGGLTNEELEELQGVGLSLLHNNDANTKVVSLDAETLYKTNASGQPDKSFFFLNANDTMSAVREYFFNNLKSRYAQSRLTEGDLVPDRSQANVPSIKAFMGGLYQDLAGPAFALTQLGERATRFFKDNLEVTLDLEAGKVTIFALIPIVTQLREIVGTLELAFSVNG